jgi:diacylglycerol O-acyltransferase
MLGSREADPMERLTAEDRLMLWPDENWPQDIGALAVLDGGGLLDPDGRFLLDAARQAVAARLHLVPRFRQVLRVPPRGLGGPLWADDPSFDVADLFRRRETKPPCCASPSSCAAGGWTGRGHCGRCGS